jgi:hypothetical protein
MRSKLALVATVLVSALMGCSSAPSRTPTTSTGGSSNAGGDSASGGNSAGASGSGGAAGSSSTTSSGGSPQQGGVTNQGGSVAAGGASSAGGNSPAGGTVAAGGKTGQGGATSPGGSVGSGGSSAPGGTTGAGGTTPSTGTGTGPQGPCDIYQSAGTPCGAAHSTVRALYSSYTGPLYQVQKSDKSTKDIMAGPDGFAKTSDQDSFCAGSSCSIPMIYDQSPNGNHLRVTWWGYWMQSGASAASATEAKITVGGHTVYGIKAGGSVKNVGYRTGVALSGTASVTKGSATVTFSEPQTLPENTVLIFTVQAKDCLPDSWPNNCKIGRNFTASAISNATTVTLKSPYQGTSSTNTGIRNETTKGLAIDDQAEAMYAVVDAKIYSQWCCFGYGNAEMTGIDEGHATMETLYFGSSTQFGCHGAGNGPWFLADLEDGMYAGDSGSESTIIPGNTSITGMSYATGMLKGLSAKDCPSGMTSTGCFALKAGNAGSGKLEWKWNATTKNYGGRPPGYTPQKKQGAIILATGGDASNNGAGIWFEGAITLGAPPDATDDAVQANINAAGYPK